MKAALLTDWENLQLMDMDAPQISGDEALIRVLYGGICGSDVTVYKGNHPTARKPVVLCHEILGHIEALPSGYAGPLRTGMRVLMNPVISCGACAACKSGYENACVNLQLLGIHVHGGFAEYTKVPVPKLVRPPEALCDEMAALGEPFAVAYHVNRRAGTSPGDKMLVVGAGLIGLVVALTAWQRGGDVYISEVNPERRRVAEQLGLQVHDPDRQPLLDAAREVTGGDGFDIVVDASGAEEIIQALPDLCRAGGVVMALGLTRRLYPFMMGAVSFKEQRLVGARLYSQEDFESGVGMLAALHKQHDMRCLVSDTVSLEEIALGMEMMLHGRNHAKILVRCG